MLVSCGRADIGICELEASEVREDDKTLAKGNDMGKLGLFVAGLGN